MSIPCVLGIDQGSSRTRAVVAALEGPQRGCLLGLGRAVGACHAYDGMDVAMEAVREATNAALAGAQATPADVRQACGGLTGADWPDEYELLREQIAGLAFGTGQSQRLAGPVRVTNDSMVALRGGTEQTYGAILVAGTGGNCAVRSPTGEEFIYGYYHEDELQGGMALGRAAMSAVYRAHTSRGPATSLSRRILDFYGFAEMDQLRRGHVERCLPRPVKDLAPIVFEEAGRGDAAAVAIVTAFGHGCAGLVVAALQRFEMLDLPLEVVLSGSIFKARDPLLVTTIAEVIHEVAPPCPAGQRPLRAGRWRRVAGTGAGWSPSGRGHAAQRRGIGPPTGCGARRVGACRARLALIPAATSFLAARPLSAKITRRIWFAPALRGALIYRRSS